MENLFASLPDSPIVSFTILLLVILTIPPLFEKINLPGLIGLLVAGVILGADGLGLLDNNSETMKLLSDIGKIYLMFVAGLEIDLSDFRKKKNKALTFGLTTFTIPLLMGTLVGISFGMGLTSSILLGSLLASHTLLGYPIVNRLGVVANEAVVVTIGATIFTDIAALLVLAICMSIHLGEFSLGNLIIQLSALGIYAALVLFGLDWGGKKYFKRTGDEESNQFLFVLLAVFLASVGAQIINVDKIVGAFLAGLAVNDAVGNSPVKEKIEFVGSTLFIPCFFVNMGLLLNVSGFALTLTQDFWLTLAVVAALITSKFLAVLVIKYFYKYHWNQALTMWSLSLPQVAATLAAALVGVNAGLLSNSVFNAIIVLMLLTSIIGPILTGKFARQLALRELTIPVNQNQLVPESNFAFSDHDPNLIREHSFTVVVPISNPHTQNYLIEMGALLARHESGLIVPLSIAKAHVHMDEPTLNIALDDSEKLLHKSLHLSQQFNVKAKKVIRIDDDVAQGISRTARENNASLIVMGWSSTETLQARLFGNVIDNVFWSSHCPVAVMRLLDEPINFRQILVPVKNITLQSLRIIRFAQIFADSNHASLTLLHVSDRQATREEIKTFESALSGAIGQISTNIDLVIKTICNQNPATAIVDISFQYDLVILRSMRRRTVAGLAVSDITAEVLKELKRSVILFGEPH
jgi:Kef-type K+ transport system membrane component KefB/nucleotide-binding universal stress UspA family protein